MSNFFRSIGYIVEIAILTDEISLDINEALEEGKSLGFRKFELRCADSYEHRVPYLNSNVESRVLREVEQNEIEITALTPGIFKRGLSDTAKIREELEVTLPKTCQLAVQLGTPRVIVFSGMTNGGGSSNDAIELIREAGQIADQFGLQLSVENEPGFYCDTGARTAAFIQSVGAKNVGINWDCANALVAGEVAYPIGYEAVLPFIQNIHIKDAIPIPPDKWENRLIGDGGVNWFGQLRAILKDAPVSHVTLETHVFPVLEATREDVRRLRVLFEAIDELND